MGQNYKLKRMFRSSLARRVGWLALIAMFGFGLLCSPLIQESRGLGKVPPQTPQKRKQEVKVEKKTGVENSAMAKLLQTGSVKGKINYFDSWATGPKIHGPYIAKGGCFGDFKLNGETARVALEGFLVKGQDGKEGNATVKPDCSYEFKAVPPGTYKLQAFVTAIQHVDEQCAAFWYCSPEGYYLDRTYLKVLLAYTNVATYRCSGANDPDCLGRNEMPITIQAGKTTTMNLSVVSNQIWNNTSHPVKKSD